MKQTQKQKGNDSPFAFKCGYCSFMRTTEGSKVLRFEGEVEARVCSHCVEATEEYRKQLPIVAE